MNIKQAAQQEEAQIMRTLFMLQNVANNFVEPEIQLSELEINLPLFFQLVDKSPITAACETEKEMQYYLDRFRQFSGQIDRLTAAMEKYLAKGEPK